MHLAGKAFIEALGALKDDDKDEDEEWLDPLDLDDEEEVDEPVDFDPADLLGKVLALINQVCLVILSTLSYGLYHFRFALYLRPVSILLLYVWRRVWHRLS